MKRRILIAILIVSSAAVLGLGILLGLLLRRGEDVLGPEARTPPGLAGVPENVLASTWRYFGGVEPLPVKIGAGRFLVLWASARSSRDPVLHLKRAELQAPYLVARDLVTEQRRGKAASRHLDGLAGSLWLAREWRTEELLAYFLTESLFGHSVVGIERAAETFFGMKASELDALQIQSLLVLTERPSSYSVWCSPGAVASRVALLLGTPAEAERIHAQIAGSVSQAPAGECAERPTVR